jgi:glycine betaine catabolism A
MTMDGKLACSRLMGDFKDPDLGSVRMLSLPNNWNHLLSDYMMAFRVMPISAQQTIVTTKWLVHKDAIEGVDYDINRLTEVWRATNEQDKDLAEWNQAGINSSSYEPGPYSGMIEMGVRDLIQWYTDSLEISLLQALDLPASMDASTS